MMSKRDAITVSDLCHEVNALTADVIREIDLQDGWEFVDGHGKYIERKYKTPAPLAADHPGNTIASAALKRRSMDLTRALAQLRRA